MFDRTYIYEISCIGRICELLEWDQFYGRGCKVKVTVARNRKKSVLPHDKKRWNEYRIQMNESL